MQKIIYLDNAATTYPKPEAVYQAMDDANRRVAVNAGRGSYALAQEASGLIEETRNLILKIVKAKDVAEVVFTASATLACNQILGGISWKKQDVVYVSPYEHNAVMRTLHQQKELYGFQIRELAIDLKTLKLDLEKIAYQFAENPPRVVIMTQVSNVTGYILPVSQVLALAKEYQPITMVDASQAFCLLPIELRCEDVDFYIFAGHKTPYGPLGVGGFVNNSGRKLKTYLAGGTGSDSLNLKMPESSSLRYEPGSPNVVAIAGLKAALEELWEEKSGQGAAVVSEEKMKNWLQQEQDLTAYLVSQLSAIPEVELYVPQNPAEHVGIVAFNISGYQSEDVAMILDEDYHIAVRAGYHCAPLIHKYIPNMDSVGVVRASIGRFTTKEEVDELVRGARELAEG